MLERIEEGFEKKERYILYRTVKDILYPSISKKNISNYRIKLEENLLPVRVYYPKKVSNMKKVIIYVPGIAKITNCKNKYASICTNLSLELDRLIIAIDYFKNTKRYPSILDNIENIITYLYEELNKLGINNDDIILMGDSTGANYISSITFRLNNKNNKLINKEILFYPVLSSNYYKTSKYKSISMPKTSDKKLIEILRKYEKMYAGSKENYILKEISPILNDNFDDYPDTLVITGDLDPLKEEGEDFAKQIKNSMYYNIKYATHGFLGTENYDVKDEYINKLREFI